MAGIDDNLEKFLNAIRIIHLWPVECSLARWLVAEYIFEDLAKIPVEVEYASEFPPTGILL